MKQEMNFGIIECGNAAFRMTLRAAHVKDYLLRRKSDRRFKEIANEIIMNRGYIIATPAELEGMYPELFKASSAESKKMIWAVSFHAGRNGNRMCFLPVR